MTFAAFTQFDSPFKPVADITLPRLMAYCDSHCYALTMDQNPVITINIMWDRLPHMLTPSTAHWFVHFDTDVLITNPGRTLEELVNSAPPSAHIIVGKDVHGINNGVQMVRNSVAGLILVQRMLGMRNLTGVLCPQDALRDLIKEDEQVKSIVHVAQQRSMNSYLYGEYGLPDTTEGQWQPGDLLLHLPGRSNERRVQLFSSILQSL